jgi:signal transduction histidine kinase/ActR/RegA family two-component response regulator
MEQRFASSDSVSRPSALLESLGGIVWEAAADTLRLLYVSPQAEGILGYPASHWLEDTRFWESCSHPADVGRWVEALREAVRTRRTLDIEHRVVSADRAVVWLRTTVTAASGADGVSTLRGFSADVTRYRLEIDRAQETKRFDAVGRLAGGIAHDFNNLLTVITGYAETLMTSLDPADPNLADVVEIRRAADRAAILTQQMLVFSRRQIVRPEPLDVNALVRSMGGRVRRLVGADIELRTDLAATPSAVVADPAQLEQVVLNLAANSREAMPEGGILEIRTRVTRVEEEDASDPPLSSGSYLVLTVVDTGAGRAAAEVREPSPDAFFTSREPGHAPGFGLSTVYGIVRQSGGSIRLDYESGRGTRVDVYLPIAISPEEEPSRADGAGGRTVLVVEDYGRVRDLATKVLARRGYSVLTASSGEEALAICRDHDGPIDVLVTDVVMAGMTGPELAKRVAAMRDGIAILFMSGYAGEALAPDMAQGPGVGFLGKPFTPADLVEKVREVRGKAAAR